VNETGDGHPRQSPRHHVLTGLVPASMVCWHSQGHRCLHSSDSTQMIPQPTFIENGTDPVSFPLVRNEADCIGYISARRATKAVQRTNRGSQCVRLKVCKSVGLRRSDTVDFTPRGRKQDDDAVCLLYLCSSANIRCSPRDAAHAHGGTTARRATLYRKNDAT
jgi:hypothetical protein